jgi:RNA polymerase sigma-70 factor, ECF subfamily
MHPSEQFMTHYIKYEPKIRSYIQRLVFDSSDAEDIMQSTAMLLWKKHDNYDPSQAFLPWAYKFAYNEIRNYYRKNEKKKLFLDQDCIDQLADTSSQFSNELSELKTHLDECLYKLENQERRLIEYRYCEDGQINDLAKKRNTTPNALSKSLQKIRQKLFLCVRVNRDSES